MNQQDLFDIAESLVTVAEKIKTGEYRIAQVPKTKGRWECDPIAVPLAKTLVPTS